MLRQIKRMTVIMALMLGGCSGYQPSDLQDLAETVAEVSDTVNEVGRAVADVDSATEDKLIQTIELVRAGNEASSEVNPYAVPIEAGLAGLTGILGIFAAYKSSKAKKAMAKYTAHKVGVEKTIKDLSTMTDSSVTASEVDSALYRNIGDARKNNS